jgi:hypothetical protein
MITGDGSVETVLGWNDGRREFAGEYTRLGAIDIGGVRASLMGWTGAGGWEPN